MGFLFKAAFWIALAAYLVPSDFTKNIGIEPGDAAARAESGFELRLEDAYLEAANICLNNPQLCAAGVSALDAAQDLAVDGLDAVAKALDEEEAEQAAEKAEAMPVKRPHGA
jgi:hypothetical protein